MLFASCHKTGLKEDPNDKKVDPVQFKINANQWLQSKKELSADVGNFIKGFEYSAKWDGISYSSLSENEYLVFLPVNINVGTTGLVFFVDKYDLKIQNCFAVSITSSGSPSPPSEIIKGLLRGKNCIDPLIFGQNRVKI